MGTPNELKYANIIRMLNRVRKVDKFMMITIILLDFKRRGKRDDDLLKYFVKPMKRGIIPNL